MAARVPEGCNGLLDNLTTTCVACLFSVSVAVLFSAEANVLRSGASVELN